MAVFTVNLQQASGVGFTVAAGRGPKGDGFTGGSYNSDTGIVTFTSNDGIGFSTDDLRGDLSEPGPIGDVTPNTGSFTSLSSTGLQVAGNNIPTSGPLSGFRNAIINGNFDHWQRGTSATTSAGGSYLSDRWILNISLSGGSVTQSRQSFSVGQTDVPNEPKYFYRMAGSSASSPFFNVAQKIEDVRTFAGQTVTLSFYAKASAARDIQPRLRQEFDGSTPVDTTASAVSLTTSWQKFTRTITLPSISGKTVGSNSRLELSFDVKEGAFGSDLGSDSIDIAQVQLEAGSVATPFERRPVGTELALCQRYFCKTYNVSTEPGSVTDEGVQTTAPEATLNFVNFNTMRFPVLMRSNPSVLTFNPVTGSTSNSVRNYSAGSNLPINVHRIGQFGFSAFVQNSSVGFGNLLGFHYTADAEL